MAELRLFDARDDRRGVSGDVLDQAVQWMTMLQSGMAGQEDLDACRRWRMAHPDNELAWQRLEQLRGDVRQGTSDLPAPVARGVLARSARTHGRRQAVKWMVGALGIGTIGLVAMGRGPVTLPQLTADYSTGVGERQRVVLPDGSELMLNTGSAVDVAFEQGQRVVVLQQGEIHIQTAGGVHAQPFVVRAGQADITPLGTRFAVRRFDSGDLRVAVREGAVSLRQASAHAGHVVHAGQQGGFQASGWTGAQPLADLSDSWVDGALVVERMALADFLEELGRYRRGIVRCDPAVARLQVSGAFLLSRTDAILDDLAAILPITVRRLTPYWVMLSPATQA